MEQDIYTLPEITITEAEERAFTDGETLIDYLAVFGAKLSGAALARHLGHLEVTEAQLPALLDYAGRRGIIEDSGDRELSSIPRIRAVGLLMLDRLEEHGISMKEPEKKTLRLLFGLEDGPPLSAEDTARVMDITADRVRHIALRACQRLSRAARRQRQKERIREFIV